MPLRLVLVLAVVVFLAALLIGALGGLRMQKRLESRASRARTRRGLRAERAAEQLLVRSGYRVLARQVPGEYELSIDGEAYRVQLSADFLVSRGGRELLVEVKTGDGTRVAHAETRRQMLEYQLAYGVPAMLLVDADAGTVQEVCFPIARAEAARGRALPWLFAGACAAAAAWAAFIR